MLLRANCPIILNIVTTIAKASIKTAIKAIIISRITTSIADFINKAQDSEQTSFLNGQFFIKLLYTKFFICYN